VSWISKCPTVKKQERKKGERERCKEGEKEKKKKEETGKGIEDVKRGAPNSHYCMATPLTTLVCF